MPENSSTGYLLIATSGGLNQQRIGVSCLLTSCCFVFTIPCVTFMIFSLQITDAVVVAWILNATLVVPELDHHSFWKDERWAENWITGHFIKFAYPNKRAYLEIEFVVCSDFSDIFDVDWFISYLSKDVTIVKRIPYEVMLSMDKLPWTMRAPRKSMPEFYIDEVLPILLRRRVSNITNQRNDLEIILHIVLILI